MNALEVFKIMRVKPELARQFRAMTELEQFKLAYCDPLTGLYHRRAFELDEREYVLLIDLDSFKWINDTFGHKVGDSTLVEFGSLLSDIFGKDNCYRTGGDEFAVKFSSPNRLEDFVRRVLGVGALRASFPGFTFGVGNSVLEADNNLYENKRKREAQGTRAPSSVEPCWAPKYFNKYPRLSRNRRENRDQ